MARMDVRVRRSFLAMREEGGKKRREEEKKKKPITQYSGVKYAHLTRHGDGSGGRGSGAVRHAGPPGGESRWPQVQEDSTESHSDATYCARDFGSFEWDRPRGGTDEVS